MYKMKQATLQLASWQHGRITATAQWAGHMQKYYDDYVCLSVYAGISQKPQCQKFSSVLIMA